MSEEPGSRDIGHMRHALSALMGCLILSPSAGLAQSGIEYRSPSSVNDCTFVKDPTALRDCLDFVEGRRVGPRIVTSAGAPPVPPTLIREAAPSAPSARTDRNLREAPPASVDPVRVEQIGSGRGTRPGQ